MSHGAIVSKDSFSSDRNRIPDLDEGSQSIAVEIELLGHDLADHGEVHVWLLLAAGCDRRGAMLQEILVQGVDESLAKFIARAGEGLISWGFLCMLADMGRHRPTRKWRMGRDSNPRWA